MTVKRTYTCNFCGGSDEAKLIGIRWDGNVAGSFKEQTNWRSVENHLCRPCIRTICEIGKTMNLEYDS